MLSCAFTPVSQMRSSVLLVTRLSHYLNCLYFLIQAASSGCINTALSVGPPTFVILRVGHRYTSGSCGGMSIPCSERNVLNSRFCISRRLSMVGRLCACGHDLSDGYTALTRCTIQWVARKALVQAEPCRNSAGTMTPLVASVLAGHRVSEGKGVQIHCLRPV